MFVKEIMTRNVESIRPDSTIFEAARIMKDHNIGSLPVIEESNCLGFITDRDITIRCIAENKDPQKTPINECMTKDLITIYEDESVEEASKKMCDYKVRRMVVVNRNEKPVGMMNLKHIGTSTNDTKLANKTMHDFFQEGVHVQH